ncbi:hypothetical protein COO60DRAFT_358029 [Scenedesmus sp. NREL 46B-D3]|nr:hypothetical protein COO60DRAFT_358029 [Scenedesmus sp. NREL 46B-D3]
MAAGHEDAAHELPDYTEEEHKMPLLLDHQADHSSLDGSQKHPQLYQAAASAAAAAPPPAPGRQRSQRRHSSELDIQASVAAYPEFPGQSADESGLAYLQNLPDVMHLWHSQRGVMLAWLVSSVVLLLLFAPFFITTGLFLGAEMACILCVMASSVYLCRRSATDGLELGSQIKLAATCGAAAFFLDCLSAFVDLLLVWSVDCEGDDACASVMNYAVVFGLSLTWHAYLSVVISQRARSLLPLLNPVSSGIVQL